MIKNNLDATTRLWRKRDIPRTFLLKFDQSKLKSANPAKRLAYQEKQELWGVLFPNGAVSLERDFVNYFHTFTEMCDSFGTIGMYDVIWLDEEEQVANE